MKAWYELLEQLKRKLGTSTFDQWLRPLKLLTFDAANLYLDAENAFQVSWLREHLLPHLSKKLKTPSGKPIKLHLSILGTSCDAPHHERQQRAPLDAPSSPFPPDPIQESATFDHFILGEEKSLPYTILKELASGEKPLGYCNPLYLYGPPGSGKTHLLMALANALKKRGIPSFYIRSETFAEHVIRAFRSTSLQEFRKAYRAIDGALIIDDVHLLLHKTVTQEELFHTFNRLHTAGKQILLSASLPPSRLDGIEKRLISRFEWGLTLPLREAGEGTRLAILQARAAQLDFPLSSALTSLLAQHFHSLHSLLQALEALALRLPSAAAPPDTEIVLFHLQDLITIEEKRALTSEKILNSVARSFQVAKEEVLGKSQHKEHTLPRKIAMYLCRERLQMAYPKIGRLFGRDHSTVMSSVRQVEEGKQKKEEAFLLPLQEIEQSLD